MQTNSRLFTDRPLHATQTVTDDEMGAFLEGLAHLGLVLILLGASFFSAQRACAPVAPATPEASVVAEATPSPAPVVRSL